MGLWPLWKQTGTSKNPIDNLSGKVSYKQLTQDPTLQHNRMVNQTIERFKNEKLHPQKTADGLKVSNSKTPKFYVSSKIHKPNNPGRPVIIQLSVTHQKF